MVHYRQGDLLIQKIDCLPKKLKKVLDNVLLRGEVTGHSHRVEDGQVFSLKDQLFIDVPQLATIVHGEHKPIKLNKGYYAVIRQREYTSADMTRLVVD